MKAHIGVNTNCQTFDEFIEEGTVPQTPVARRAEAVRPSAIHEFTEEWGTNEAADRLVLQTLVQVIATETDSHARSRMVDTVARLQALQQVRTQLQRNAVDPLLVENTIASVRQLFPTDSDAVTKLFGLLSHSMTNKA